MKLTDTQRALLEAAAQHPQKKLTNFPETLKGGARIKVLTAMRGTQLIAPSATDPEVYVATQAGLQAIGIPQRYRESLRKRCRWRQWQQHGQERSLIDHKCHLRFPEKSRGIPTAKTSCPVPRDLNLWFDAIEKLLGAVKIEHAGLRSWFEKSMA